MFKTLEAINTTEFAFNGDRAYGERGIAVYRRRNSAGLEVISIHRVYSAGETSNPAFDGWSNHETLDDARKAWQATRDLWVSQGWQKLEPSAQPDQPTPRGSNRAAP